MMVVIQMSDRELTRLRTLIDLAENRLTIEAAGTLMGRSFGCDTRSRLTDHRRWRLASAAARAIGDMARRSGAPS
jgi:hypothetical protein